MIFKLNVNQICIIYNVKKVVINVMFYINVCKLIFNQLMEQDFF